MIGRPDAAAALQTVRLQCSCALRGTALHATWSKTGVELDSRDLTRPAKHACRCQTNTKVMEAMGRGADAPCMYGSLQLLDEQGVQRYTYTIRKSTITLGRYVTLLMQRSLE